MRFVSCIKLVVRNSTCLRYGPSYNQLEREAPCALFAVVPRLVWKMSKYPSARKSNAHNSVLDVPESRSSWCSHLQQFETTIVWQAWQVLALQHNKMAESSWWRVDIRRTGTLQCRWFSHTLTKRIREESSHVSRLRVRYYQSDQFPLPRLLNGQARKKNKLDTWFISKA